MSYPKMGVSPKAEIRDYKVLRNSDLLTLINEVNGHLGTGWQPQGGLGIGPENGVHPYMFYQAMIFVHDGK